MAADLKPCPFCGESLALYEPRREGDNFWQHPTGNCTLARLSFGEPIVVFDHPADIAAWNTRAAGVETSAAPADPQRNNPEN